MKPTNKLKEELLLIQKLKEETSSAYDFISLLKREKEIKKSLVLITK